MNTLIASTFTPEKGMYLPASRINGGRLSLEALSAFGITADGDVNDTGFRHCMLPTGWHPVSTPDSDFQVRLLDGLGRLRAKIFYKPGSQGGRGSMEVWTRYTVALETNETLQWGEVYDGNELIHRSATGPKVVDKMGMTNHQQPEYVAAEAWLTSQKPDHQNPLAYWK